MKYKPGLPLTQVLSSPPHLTWGLKLKFVENYFFLKNDVTTEGAVSNNVLYYQQLYIARYQVRFYGNNYFD